MSQLALVIDLNVCVGCHACVTNCKEWNTSGNAGALSDDNPYGKDPTGTFFNRVQTFHHAYRSVLRVPATSVRKMVLCWWIMTSVLAVVIAPGPVHTVPVKLMSIRR